MTPNYKEVVAEYDYQRTMAFKRIREQFHSPRRRTKEMLRWYKLNPSPRTPEEKLANLKCALLDEQVAQ